MPHSVEKRDQTGTICFTARVDETVLPPTDLNEHTRRANGYDRSSPFLSLGGQIFVALILHISEI